MSFFSLSKGKYKFATLISSLDIWFLDEITITIFPKFLIKETAGAKSLSPESNMAVSKFVAVWVKSSANSTSILPSLLIFFRYDP